ncbi:Hypothetical predicted protein [Paramuricea clavata]|uniref:Uncharacterized protein n=1 Tax=Paramuricea clavata TaxID=317549 RepID=A0A6S7FXH6_PARCT|nr:Hypothetical predicted protein [Paramuricea clavata]
MSSEKKKEKIVKEQKKNKEANVGVKWEAKKMEVDPETVEMDHIEDTENKQEDRKRILQEIVDRYLENKTKERLQEEAEGALLEQYLKLKNRHQKILYESNV